MKDNQPLTHMNVFMIELNSEQQPKFLLQLIYTLHESFNGLKKIGLQLHSLRDFLRDLVYSSLTLIAFKIVYLYELVINCTSCRFKPTSSVILI